MEEFKVGDEVVIKEHWSNLMTAITRDCIFKIMAFDEHIANHMVIKVIRHAKKPGLVGIEYILDRRFFELVTKPDL
jgi:hypothetical protein